MRAAKLALSRARDAKTPRQFGPTSLQAGCPGRFLAGVGERAGAMAEPRGDDDGGCCSFLAARGDDPRARTAEGPRSRGDRGRLRQFIDGLDRLDPLDLVVARVDETD